MAAIQNFKLEDGSTLVVQGDFSYEIIDVTESVEELSMNEVLEDLKVEYDRMESDI